jgi:hypothetical protein
MKHTPGPWRIADRDPRCGPELNILGPSPYADGEHTATFVAVVRANDKEHNLVTAGGWVTPHEDEAQANARLMECAPDLLKDATAAVEAWVHAAQVSYTDPLYLAIRKLAATVAKAGGALVLALTLVCSASGEYASASKSAKTFHKAKTCMSLARSKTVVELTRAQAEQSGKRPCGICWRKKVEGRS